MIMTLNDVLTKQNVLTKVILKDDSKELPKELKVKIMRIRMAYNKIKKNFDTEVQEFSEQLMTDEFKELQAKTERTFEEETRYKELSSKINSEYQEFLVQKGEEEISEIIEDSFNMNEYTEILDVNSGNNVDFNGTKIPATDFLEVLFELFVKE